MVVKRRKNNAKRVTTSRVNVLLTLHYLASYTVTTIRANSITLLALIQSRCDDIITAMVTTQFMKHFWCARLLLAFIPRRYGFVPHRQQVQISRHLFHLLKGSIGGGAADLVEQVKDLMSRSPYIESRICIADDINYSCDLLSFTGGDNYTSLQAQW